MNTSDILSVIPIRANDAPGDYRGEDGLLRCGKCNEPKQCIGQGALLGRLLPIPCRCMREEQEEEERKRRQPKIDAMRERCFPNTSMREHRFEKADQSKSILTARRYTEKWAEMRSKNIGLLFFGNTGTGKSFAAQCICNALIDQEIPARYVTAVEIVSCMMDRNKSPDDFMQMVRSVPLLVVDDIGAERDTPFSREQLCFVIDARGESGKPLIVTTNISLTDMEKCTDQGLQRLFNRIKALCVPVAVIGKSRRDEIGKAKLEEAKRILEL